MNGDLHDDHHQEEAEQAQNQVCDDARQRNLQIVAPAVSQVVRVDRNRLGPAEAHQKHAGEADGVDVAQRVQADAAHEPRRGVAAAVGDVGVRGFVRAQRQQDAGQAEQKTDQRRAGIV